MVLKKRPRLTARKLGDLVVVHSDDREEEADMLEWVSDLTVPPPSVLVPHQRA